MTPQQQKESEEFFENVRLMRKHYHDYIKSHSSKDLDVSKKYGKKVDEYVKMIWKEKQSMQKNLF